MESIGSVNQYTCETCGHGMAVLLLNTGVTGFSKSCPLCTRNGNYDSFMASHFYRVRVDAEFGFKLKIQQVMYRPRVLSDDPSLRHHLLNGGLISAEVGEPIDPLYPDCGDVSYQAWCDYTTEHWGTAPCVS